MAKRLGEMLVEANLITEVQLRGALGRQKKWGGRLGSNLIKLGNITEDELRRFLAAQTGVEEIDISTIQILPHILKLVPRKVAEQYCLIPIAMKDKSTVMVACADPTDLTALDQVSFVSGLKVEPVISTHSAITTSINKFYGAGPTNRSVSDPIAISGKDRDPDLVPLSSMDQHGGQAASSDPELIIFGTQTSGHSINNQGRTPTRSTREAPAPVRPVREMPPPPTARPTGPTLDENEFTLDFSPEWAAQALAQHKPPPRQPAPKTGGSGQRKFTTDEKLRALYKVMIRKGLITEREVYQELLRLRSQPAQPTSR